MAACAASSSTDPLSQLEELDDGDFSEFQQDAAVQEALLKGTDLRNYASEVESALRAVERESIHDYIKESENLAGLHTQIRDCDNVLDSMEQMLRGFQTDLGSISAQIKYLQDESLSMNVKLRNRKSAETQLSTFIHQIVIAPELIQNICDAEVNETYLEYVTELNEKVSRGLLRAALDAGQLGRWRQAQASSCHHSTAAAAAHTFSTIFTGAIFQARIHPHDFGMLGHLA